MKDLYYLLATPMTYVEIALVLFVAVFISVLVRELSRNKREIQHMEGLPLQDDAPVNTKESPR